MAKLNRIQFIGNLGKEPRQNVLDSGTSTSDFPVGVNDSYVDAQGNQQEKTTWYRVYVYGRQADACNQYLGKGDQVLVEGRMKADDYGNPRIWYTKEGNHARTSFEINAQRVEFLQRAGGNAQGRPAQRQRQEQQVVTQHAAEQKQPVQQPVQQQTPSQQIDDDVDEIPWG